MAKHGKTLFLQLKGFDKPVSLEQAVNGFMRHSDYTNKTQEIADIKRDLESKQARFTEMDGWFKALDSKPAETMRALQRAYNVPMSESGETGTTHEQDDEVASLRSDVQRLTQQLEQTQSSTVETAAVQDFRQQFPDLDITDVQAYMKANAIEPHRVIEGAKMMMFDRNSENQQMHAQAQAEASASAASPEDQAQIAAIEAQKSELPPISPGAAPTPSPDMMQNSEPPLPSFNEAAALAQAEHSQGGGFV